MILRDLLVKVGFSVDQSSVNQAETTVDNVKAKLGQIEKVTNQVDVATKKAVTTAKDGFAATAKVAAETSRRTADVSKNIADIGKNAEASDSKLNALVGRLNAFLAFAGVSLSVGSIIRIVDSWKLIDGQVRNVTSSQHESIAAQKELYNIASRTRQQYQSTAQLYTSVARNAQELKKSSADILAFTEDVSNAMLLGGGSQQAQDAALVQLGQALGSGTLRGDELNSIMEQAPRLAKAIAEGMGTTIGQLRKMGAEGKLTAIDVFNAIRGQSERLKMEMGKVPWTVEQATNRMSNAIGRLFYEVEKRSGIVGTVASGIAKVADYIEQIDIDSLVAGFRLLGIYAAAFFVVSKWSAVAQGLRILGVMIGIVGTGYKSAAWSAAAFQAASLKASAVALLPFAKFLLIAAAITAVIFVLQDFYTWITGGDSIIGRYLGRWNEFAENARNKWDEVTAKIKDFLNMRVIDMIKIVLGWIGKIPEKLSAAGDWLKGKFNQPMMGLLTQKAAAEGGPELSEAQKAAYLAKGYIGTSASAGGSQAYADNSTHTNYVTVHAKTNASAEDIGAAVADAIPQNSPFGSGTDFLAAEAGDA